VQWLKRKFDALFAAKPPAPPPSAPDGMTIYAVGDIHGRADLLQQLLDQISADVEATRNTQTVLAFLGDYIDRGPQSRGVIETLMQLKKTGEDRVIALKGNHEEALLGFLADPQTGPGWAEHGGRETLLSYGVALPKHRTDADGWARTRDDFAKALPAEHLSFLRNLSLCESLGDYVFVHAGVRPGVPLHEQEERDLLWIREEFLQGDRAMDKMVVHGHTPVEQPSIGAGRIGIDTGAYATGVLTALKLRGEEQSFLQTGT